jgi:hypothetical protein
METNLCMIKNATKAIARAVPPQDTGFGDIVIHPFVSSSLWFDSIEKEPLNLLEEESYNIWLEQFDKVVDKASLRFVYMQWRDPWKLTFMKFCGEYLSEQDYAEYLADAWVTEENPNMDSNVSRKEAIKMFKSCKKQYLMTAEDYEYYNHLPNEVELYRGVSKGRIKLGLSWTNDKDKAKWFMNRWESNSNCLLKVKVQKKDIIAYFNTRNEKECLLDVFKYQNKIKEVRKL